MSVQFSSLVDVRIANERTGAVVDYSTSEGSHSGSSGTFEPSGSRSVTVDDSSSDGGGLPAGGIGPEASSGATGVVGMGIGTGKSGRADRFAKNMETRVAAPGMQL